MGVAQNCKSKCFACGKRRKLVAFTTFRVAPGKNGRKGVCEECKEKEAETNEKALLEYRHTYNKKHASERHKQQSERRAVGRNYTDAIKAATPCADCGKRWPPVAMDFDHVRGAKFKSVSLLISGAYKLDLIKQEIAKCDVVCACCHRIRTSKRGENLGGSVRKLGRRRTGGWKKNKSDTDRLSEYPPKVNLTKKLLEFKGESHSISEWARRVGLNPSVVIGRLNRGYPIEAALKPIAYSVSNSPLELANLGIGQYKLTKAQVIEIRTAYAAGESYGSIAKRFKVSYSSVHMIVNRKTWRHVRMSSRRMLKEESK